MEQKCSGNLEHINAEETNPGWSLQFKGEKNLHNYDREKEKKDKICLKSEAVTLKKEGYRVSGAGVGELG